MHTVRIYLCVSAHTSQSYGLGPLLDRLPLQHLALPLAVVQVPPPSALSLLAAHLESAAAGAERGFLTRLDLAETLDADRTGRVVGAHDGAGIDQDELYVREKGE